jgi:hypothetical protein
MRKNVWLRLGGASMLAAFALLAGYTAPASAQDAPSASRVVLPGKGKPGSPFNLASSSTYLLNHNAWVCGLAQIGNVCSSAVGSSVGGGGFWPQGTANQYIFNSGLQVGALIGPDGGAAAGDTVATFFFHASGPGASTTTPFWETVGDGSGCRATTCAPGYIYASDRQIDLDNWPEECYIDNPVFGRVKTLSELDTCVQYWDGDPTASHFTDSHPMGLLVTQHSLVWSFPNNRDIMFYIYRFKNVSNTEEFRRSNPSTPATGWTLRNVYAAFAADPDVSGSEYIENYATVVPQLNLGVTWQYDFEASDFVAYAPTFDAAVGFFGVKFLKSPVNNSDTTVTVNVNNVARPVAPGEELGLTFFSIFTNGGIMSDAANGHQGYRYLSGKLGQQERQQWCVGAPTGMCYVNIQTPDDMRFYQSSGPFELSPGEEAEIVVAYLAGAPVPGTYTKGQVIPVGQVTDTTRAIEKAMGRGYNVPGFPSLFANARTAQAIYDANFVLPAAPSGPVVTVIPGNKQNTVLWDASSVARQDPFCQLASDPTNALYDPNFVCQDFEGFRVYRKSNPAAPWTPIAQFDLANGIVEQITVLSSVIPEGGGDPIVVSADTARVCQSETAEQLGLSAAFAGCTADTGLNFAIIDRGGSFPDPSNGPGLINGIRYYYTVTAFDINSPQSGPSTLESAKVLSQNASGVPRANAPNLTASTASEPVLMGGTTVLDPTAAVPAIDAETGVFAGRQPPTDGIELEISAVPENLEADAQLTVRVDSIVPGSASAGVPNQYHLTVTGPGGSHPLTIPVAIGYTSTDVYTGSGALLPQVAKAVGTVTISHPGSYLLANSNRGAVNHIGQIPSARPRWFVSGSPEVADPTAGNNAAWCAVNYGDASASFTDTGDYCAAVGKPIAGDLPGYVIAPMNGYSTLTSVTRGVEGVLSGVWRAADIEITWGDNGAVTSVMDLTHNVPIPFNPQVRGSYGFMTPASMTGVTQALTADKRNDIVTFSDYTCLHPLNEYSIQGLLDTATPASCKSPVPAQLQPQAAIVTVNWPGPTWSTQQWHCGGAGACTAANLKQGFSMYIAGQIYHFIGALPAAGTKWTLRSFAGLLDGHPIDAGTQTTDYNEYTFESTVRPPNITGLTVQTTLSGAVLADVTEADLERVHTVPDPYYVTNILENSSAEKRMQFVNLPPEAVVRIYSLSGVLLNVLEHNDASGGGTLEWDMRTRNNQFIASGVYFFHVETPNGKTKVGKFTVVQFAQ